MPIQRVSGQTEWLVVSLAILLHVEVLKRRGFVGVPKHTGGQQMATVLATGIFLDGTVQRSTSVSGSCHAPIVCITTRNGFQPGEAFKTRTCMPVVLQPVGNAWVFADTGILIPFTRPRRSRSNRSAAVYLASGRVGETVALLQFIPPFSTTSRHYHRLNETGVGSSERFIPLAGFCGIGLHDYTVDGEALVEVSLDPEEDSHVEVAPGVPHYIFTGEAPALNLLLITHRSDPLDTADHVYMPWK